MQNKPDTDDSEFSRSLREKVDMHKAPDHLRRRIAASIERQGALTTTSWLLRCGRTLSAQWRSLAAAAACGAAAIWLAGNFFAISTADEPLMRQVATSHARAMVTNRLIDVVSSDTHTVKPWFAGKVDYSPRVIDFAAQGFSLAGGRVDYVDDRIVAVLIYRCRLHVIDAYVWPTKDANRGVSKNARQGINAIEWIEGGMKHVLVSDVEPIELNELARLMRVGGGQ